MTQGTNIATRALDFKLREFLNKSETEQQAAEYGYVNGATDQQAIFDKLPKVKSWVARDKGDSLYLYVSKPKKYYYDGIWIGGNYGYLKITEDQLPEGCNPKWEDDEPIEVELIINLKKG